MAFLEDENLKNFEQVQEAQDETKEGEGETETGKGTVVSIPVEDYEKLKQGAMALDDYQTKIQQVNVLLDRLQEVSMLLDEAKEARSNEKQGTKEHDDLDDKVRQLEELKGALETHLRAEAEREVEREIESFRQTHAYLFTGDAEKDNAIMAKILDTAATYQKADGSPLSLEEAFYIAFGDNLKGKVVEMLQQEAEKQKLWGSYGEDRSSNVQKVITSKEEAEMELEQRIAKYLR